MGEWGLNAIKSVDETFFRPDESAVISLQRKIFRQTGNRIEPDQTKVNAIIVNPEFCLAKIEL